MAIQSVVPSANYFIFRYSVGWKCGLHADFTELRECVPRMLNTLENHERPRKSTLLVHDIYPCAMFIRESYFREVGLLHDSPWRPGTLLERVAPYAPWRHMVESHS